jgi:predicted extracellular nuclease
VYKVENAAHRPGYPGEHIMNSSTTRRGALPGVALALAALAFSPAALAVGDVVISQVYGGGGNTGAPYNSDFVELFNRSSQPVSLAGWSIQYASATGTGNFGSTTTQITPLPGISLQPGQYLLIQQASGATGSPLPTPDVTDSTPILMGATAGKVALVSSATPLGCNGGSTPCSAAQLALIVDLVGYDGANFFEGSGATGILSNTTAALRAGGGCTDTDTNSTDFSVGAPAPRNSASPLNTCAVTNAPVVASCPASVATPETVGSQAFLTARDGDGRVVSAAFDGTPPSGFALVDVVPAPGNNQPLTATLEIASFVTAGNYSVTVRFANEDATPQTATCTIAVGVAPLLRIREIQGAGHRSPYAGQSVANVPGVVTARRNNGFWIQDPAPDADLATSEGLFVFTSSAPTVVIGDSVLVSGSIVEFRPGGGSSPGLTLTEITSPNVRLIASGAALPAPVVLGAGGRPVPGLVIEDDSTFDVEAAGVLFDPANDGLDFFESLEGMRVQVNGAIAVSPTNRFGEIWVVGDGGATASPASARGGLVLDGTDFNPERILVDDVLLPLGAMPPVNVGDTLGAIVGVVDYAFNNFRVFPSSAPVRTDNGLVRETSTLTPDARLRVATFNVENLDPADDPARIAALATRIVGHLHSPDIVGVQEIQDNNGPINDAVVDASQTFGALVGAIQAAGGPAYEFVSINPADDMDGGEPGGNIRTGFLYDPARIRFVGRPGGTATAAVNVVAGPDGPALSYSPGRIDPLNPAFSNSRKPLAAEFRYNGRTVFVINNHLNSKGGDDPLFGRYQPPARSSENQRAQQAMVLKSFVEQLLAADAGARVVVLGDLNDFQFSDTLGILKSAGLETLVERLPLGERYSYVFEGNSQVLDHVLVSPGLVTDGTPWVDVVHVNAEFHDRPTDHDPTLAALMVTRPYEFGGFFAPVASAPAVNAENAGQVVPLKWRLIDGNGAPVTSLATVEALGSRPVDCATGAPLGGYQNLLAAGGTALRYDPVDDQFTYNWKTVATWGGTCREMRLGLSSDETPTALFSFR